MLAKSVITILSSALLLTGCSLIKPYRQTVTQGNIITNENIHAVPKHGSQAAVVEAMGSPLLPNFYTKDEMNYVYLQEKPYQTPAIDRATFQFSRGQVKAISRS